MYCTLLLVTGSHLVLLDNHIVNNTYKLLETVKS